YRTEKDSMGEMQVPADAYYGAQTARAVENFPISDLRFNRRFIAALGLIKSAAAEVNHKLGLLDDKKKSLIQQAAQEVIDGKLDAQFVVDIFQTGSGTSTNMNANEVIASRANELATGQRGGKEPIHPNDHVNMEQSSNDVIPTAMHVAAAMAMKESLVPALGHLSATLEKKAKQFDDIVKIGRTHLQDATPIRLGQELSGYAAQAALGAMRAQKAINALRELPLGGTAVGTGLGSSFELNVMMPVMAYNILQSIELLAKAARVFADRSAAGIEANRQRCEELVEQSLAMCTSLAPKIGYDKAADIAKESFK